MSGSDLAFQIRLLDDTVLAQICGMVLAHVMLESLTVRVRRRLPSRLLGVWVEIVREILAVGVSDLLRERYEKLDNERLVYYLPIPKVDRSPATPCQWNVFPQMLALSLPLLSSASVWRRLASRVSISPQNLARYCHTVPFIYSTPPGR